MGKDDWQRCCTACKSKFSSEQLQHHHLNDDCRLSINGQQRAERRMEKHVIHRDYKKLMYYGAIPLPEGSRNKATQPLHIRFEEEALYRHHGRSANIGEYLDKALLERAAKRAASVHLHPVAEADHLGESESSIVPVAVLNERLGGIPAFDKDGGPAVAEEEVLAFDEDGGPAVAEEEDLAFDEDGGPAVAEEEDLAFDEDGGPAVA